MNDRYETVVTNIMNNKNGDRLPTILMIIDGMTNKYMIIDDYM